MRRLYLLRQALLALGEASLTSPHRLLLELGGGKERTFRLYAHEGYLVWVRASPPYPLLDLGKFLGHGGKGREEDLLKALLPLGIPYLPWRLTERLGLLLRLVFHAVEESSRGKASLSPGVPQVYLEAGAGIRLSPEVVDLFLPGGALGDGDPLREIPLLLAGEEWEEAFPP